MNSQKDRVFFFYMSMPQLTVSLQSITAEGMKGLKLIRWSVQNRNQRMIPRFTVQKFRLQFLEL